MMNVQRRKEIKIANKTIRMDRGPVVKRIFGATGGALPREVVVTMTEAVPVADGRDDGFTLHVVADAASEQLRLTVPEKASSGAIAIAFVNVAVWPAVTV